MKLLLIHVVRNWESGREIPDYKPCRDFPRDFKLVRGFWDLPESEEVKLNYVAFLLASRSKLKVARGDKGKVGFNTKRTQFTVGFADDDQPKRDVGHGVGVLSADDARSPMGKRPVPWSSVGVRRRQQKLLVLDGQLDPVALGEAKLVAADAKRDGSWEGVEDGVPRRRQSGGQTGSTPPRKGPAKEPGENLQRFGFAPNEADGGLSGGWRRLASVPGPAESPQRQTRETEREGKAAWETRVQAQSQLRDCDFTAVALGFLYTVGGVVISFAHGAQAADKRRRRLAAVLRQRRQSCCVSSGSGCAASSQEAARPLPAPLPYAYQH